FWACGSKDSNSNGGGGDGDGDGDRKGNGDGDVGGDGDGDGDVSGDGDGDVSSSNCAELAECCPLLEVGLERDACEGTLLTGDETACSIVLAANAPVCNDDTEPTVELPPAEVVGTWGEAQLIPGTGSTTLTQEGNTIVIRTPELSAFDVCA